MSRASLSEIRSAWALTGPGRYTNPLIDASVVQQRGRWTWFVGGMQGKRSCKDWQQAMAACERQHQRAA